MLLLSSLLEELKNQIKNKLALFLEIDVDKVSKFFGVKIFGVEILVSKFFGVEVFWCRSFGVEIFGVEIFW